MVKNFTAIVNINEICINGSVINNWDTGFYNDDYTPLIDNVTLI